MYIRVFPEISFILKNLIIYWLTTKILNVLRCSAFNTYHFPSWGSIPQPSSFKWDAINIVLGWLSVYLSPFTALISGHCVLSAKFCCQSQKIIITTSRLYSHTSCRCCHDWPQKYNISYKIIIFHLGKLYS